MKDNQLTLLCSTTKPVQPLQLKRRPVELRRFKSAVFLPAAPAPACDYLPTPTQFYTAICTDKMSKTRRAYYEVQNRSRENGPVGVLESDKVADIPVKVVLEPEEVQSEASLCICNQARLGTDLMFKCEGYCGNWYHPKCLGMHWTDIDKHTKTSARWYCNECRERAYGLYLACVPQGKRSKK